jgi:predicted nucleic acid-binding protein
MCIIVDANVARHLSAPTDDGEPILKWLLRGKGGLVVGGHLKKELARSGLRAILVVLNQAGRLHTLDDDRVMAASKQISDKGICCSNDCHVIAVAIVSGCRLIFTKDQDLHKDAKNTNILRPAASIYQTKEHRHLLTECRCR